jgi:glucosamine-6-phosphate deaminase
VDMSQKALGLSSDGRKGFAAQKERIMAFIDNKHAGTVDIPEVQEIKAFIRYAEAIEGIEVMGLGPENARFLDMPFYKTGMVRKDPIGQADIDVVLDLLNEIQPDHIFVAGDLSDPHGTHRMCYFAIREALVHYNEQHKNEPGRTTAAGPDGEAKADQGANGEAGNAGGFKRPLVWLYRGAWQEWETYQADVFLPLSKKDLDRKVEAIYKHESQKDRAMFPGAYDEREFWQRARDRNRGTARSLNALGLPEFYAAEAFVTTFEL